MITLIVGRDRNGAIGKDNEIPWYAPEDLQFFKRETLGGAIIMGRNTWDSLPFKPLKDRLNIVVSSRGVEGCDTVVTSVQAAVKLAEEKGYRRIYGIGGCGIYTEMLTFADRLLVTEVELAIDDADTFFPKFSPNDWNKTGTSHLRSHAPACTVDEYLRVRSA